MDAMTPQGQALYCNEHVDNAYGFWNSIINISRPDMDIYIYWGIWYMRWWKSIEKALETYLGDESPDFDMFKKKEDD